jgi:hypothetical protein
MSGAESSGVTPIYMNRLVSDDERRRRIFEGAIYHYLSYDAGREMLQWTRELIADAFKGVTDVRNAHNELAIEDFVARAGPLKTRFTNDARTKEICQRLITAMGADPELTYFDLPRLRVIPPRTYLASGVSYNYEPHRDTWYAHPRQLINYWSAIYDTDESTVMSMFVDFFQRPVDNNSKAWDYDEWVQNSRFKAAQNVKGEERAHPLPLQGVRSAPHVRFVQNAGDLMMFSTCQLHASTPNETGLIRFSYDLRTIHIEDFRLGRGPENVDGKATGTTIGDFLRVSDLAPLNVSTPHAA